ncbi:MAG: hypothetical protein KDA87_13080 [Planctomycetales bacterium]|nr:hypothetical protein [Planctomycetales bacterium]
MFNCVFYLSPSRKTRELRSTLPDRMSRFYQLSAVQRETGLAWAEVKPIQTKKPCPLDKDLTLDRLLMLT